jgi:hypothetical protein
MPSFVPEALSGTWFLVLMVLGIAMILAVLCQVVLHWNASSSKNVRYNTYRGSVPGMHPDKLNAAPVDGLTFTDRNVQMGKSYYYVARAVDAAGQESSDSNETVATIP